MAKREVRSFLMPRDPSIDRRFRPCPQKRERLFAEIEEENYYEDSDSDSLDDEYYDTRSTGEALTESTDSSAAVETGALVFLRLKPVENPSTAYSISAEGNVLINGPPTESTSSSKNKNSMEKHYSFTEIFDPGVSQKEVFEKCLGEKILAEDSFTVLTYGTSGSGKTFTLLGDDIRPGIIPRSLENIFTFYKDNIHPNPLAKLVNARTTFLDDHLVEKENILRRHLLDNCKNIDTNYQLLQNSIRSEHNFETVPREDVSVFIWVTFVEIYNELVYDLLAPIKSTGSFITSSNAPRKNLKIVCNDGNVFIKGVTSVYIKSSAEALKLLRSGLQKVTYASTAVNANSSRSHCVFFVDVLKYYRNGVYTETSYKFCDLAGSERLDKTGNKGSRLKEAQRINTSLMVLGRCLDAANNMAPTSSSTLNKKERIPYRESKLTMILQAALQGKEKLAMIVNVTPTEKYYEENLNVLNFASIASNIIFKAPVVKQNQSQNRYSLFSNAPDNSYIQQLLEDIGILKADNEKLNRQVEQQNQQLEEIIDETYYLKEEIERLTHQHAEDLLKQEQDLRNELVDSFKKTLEEHKKQFEIRTQRELENQKRIYESRIEFLKQRHQDELEDLREEQDDNEEKNESEEIIDEDITEVIETQTEITEKEIFIGDSELNLKADNDVLETNQGVKAHLKAEIDDDCKMNSEEELENKENIQHNQL